MTQLNSYTTSTNNKLLHLKDSFKIFFNEEKKNDLLEKNQN